VPLLALQGVKAVESVIIRRGRVIVGVANFDCRLAQARARPAIDPSYQGDRKTCHDARFSRGGLSRPCGVVPLTTTAAVSPHIEDSTIRPDSRSGHRSRCSNRQSYSQHTVA
jgi:hypothetical protein